MCLYRDTGTYMLVSRLSDAGKITIQAHFFGVPSVCLYRVFTVLTNYPWHVPNNHSLYSRTYTVNIRYRHTRYRHSHDTGTLFRCTNFPPPNRLRYRHWHTMIQAHKIAICACIEFWPDRLLGGDNCFKWRF